ncbi:LAMI_0D10000g1_1 [Lachancea mirantina]|uniref:LAMI_0D10000g1_1 n=1 Tax=Lachancea mirantina TaxID=1230905 RepID=A0A1G4JE05_9SACH|nr:LAMI_0D10000g1_1 [Lachancea mirantina]
MQSICCFPLITTDEELEIALCKSSLEGFPVAESQNWNNFVIKELIVSEGSGVRSLSFATIKDLKLLGGTDSGAAWQTLIDVLAAGKLPINDGESIPSYAAWKCDIRKEPWKLVWEQTAAGITKRLAELGLDASRGRDLDLFRLSFELFQSHFKANKKLLGLQTTCDALKSDLRASHCERDKMVQLVRERDERTRSMVMELLNEKKTKIRDLQKRLDERRGPGDVSDQLVLNRFVSHPVSRMTSPEKRHASASPQKTTSPTKRKRSSPLVKGEDNLEASSEIDDFAFMGINRRRTASEAPLTPFEAEFQETKISRVESEQPSSHNSRLQPLKRSSSPSTEDDGSVTDVGSLSPESVSD